VPPIASPNAIGLNLIIQAQGFSSEWVAFLLGLVP